MKNVYTMSGEVWIYPSEHAAWHFVHIPQTIANKIRKVNTTASVRVVVTVGETEWNTSLFWHAKSQTYILPLKADIRRREGIEAGEQITFTLSVCA